jgi:hypothetical protein
VVIEPAPGLDAVALARARALGPGSMTACGDLSGHVREAGLNVIETEDWTSELEVLLNGLSGALRVREDALRAAEGDAVYEHERSKKEALLEGVREGLLVRTLVVAVR